ncbi:MAG: DUF308 domain-containing protein [Eggerthellales bacterium]|nr:DUF308 domain-containing protein [Eggerthellales bacterium]
MQPPINVRVVSSRTEGRIDPEPVRSTNWTMLLAGFALACLGLVCILAPGGTLLGISTLTGVGIMLGSLLSILSCYRANKYLPAGFARSYVMPSIMLVMGLMLVMSPIIGVRIFSVMAGVAVIGFGVFRIASASFFALFSLIPAAGSWLGGLIAIVLGVLMFIWPQYMAIILGVFVLLFGVDTFISGLPLKR